MSHSQHKEIQSFCNFHGQGRDKNRPCIIIIGKFIKTVRECLHLYYMYGLKAAKFSKLNNL